MEKNASTTAAGKVFVQRATPRKIATKRPALQDLWTVAQKPDLADAVDEALALMKKRKDRASREFLLSWRLPTSNWFCNVCGGHGHNAHFCPYNYVCGFHRASTCRERCGRGQHPLGSESRRGFLRRFVRVNNLPQDFTEWELGTLFQVFGPVPTCDLERYSAEVCMGFGYVIFENREHAEKAIDTLNGYDVGGHKLRVDWAYPRT